MASPGYLGPVEAGSEGLTPTNLFPTHLHDTKGPEQAIELAFDR